MNSLPSEATVQRPCPSCGATSVTPRKILPNAEVLACSRCELTFAASVSGSGCKDPIETEESFYHGIMGDFWKQQALARELVPRRLAAYERWLGRPVRSLLEIGCATGAYATAYSELGIRYCGVEIDPRLAEFAKSHSDIEFINSNFFDLPDIGTFDVIFASQVLEHVQDPSAFLNHAKGLAPAGLIHVDVPNHDSLVATVRKIVSRTEHGFIQPPHHMIAYNRTALAHLFDRCGLHPLLLAPYRNDHTIWGQLVVAPTLLHRLSYAGASALGRGSLLVGVGAARDAAVPV